MKVCGEMDQGGRISGGWRWGPVGADVGQTQARQFTPTMHVQHLVGVTVRHPITLPCMRRSHAPIPLPSSHMPRPYCSPSATPPARPPAAPAGRGRVAGWPARAGSCDHNCALTCAHPHPGNVACFSAASLPRVVDDSWYYNNTMRTHQGLLVMPRARPCIPSNRRGALSPTSVRTVCDSQASQAPGPCIPSISCWSVQHLSRCGREYGTSVCLASENVVNASE